MSMIVTHNMLAENAGRQLNATTGSKKKSMEKLSSGYRINRSADDAAGLSISEKMRWQVRGLDRATANVQDGISLIQTADGALNEVHNALQRMNELATQAANDTNTDDDRNAIQKEISALKALINRISDYTTFNDRTILKAKQLVEIDCDDFSTVIMEDKFSGIPNTTGSVYGKAIDFGNVNINNKEQLINKKFTVTCSQNCSQTFKFEFTDGTSTTSSISGSTTSGRGSLTVQIGMKDTSLNNGADIVKRIYDTVVGQQGALGGGGSNPIHIGHANGLHIDGSRLIMYSIADGPPYAYGMGQIYADDLMVKEEQMRLQVSCRPFQEIAVQIRTINPSTLGLGNLNVSTHEAAGDSMNRIQRAVEHVSDYRSYLGALQNRLEHTMLNNQNVSENTQSAESRLRDTDMPEELLNNTKFQILQNAGHSLLAQANQQTTDGILRLLV